MDRAEFRSFDFSCLGFVSDFEFRISDLDVGGASPTVHLRNGRTGNGCNMPAVKVRILTEMGDLGKKCEG